MPSPFSDEARQLRLGAHLRRRHPAAGRLLWSGVMTFILGLVIGGVLGWLASIVKKTNTSRA